GKKMAKKKTHRTWGRIEQLPSGNFRAKFKHGGILHKAPSTFKEKASAEAWLNRNKAEIDKAEALGYKWVYPAERENQTQLSSTTVKDLIETWLADEKALPKLSTRQSHSHHINARVMREGITASDSTADPILTAADQ